MTQKLSEQSAGRQLASLLGIVGVVVTIFGGLAIWAADSAIDQKYATDADVKAVQVTTEAAVARVEIAVNANTAVVKATSSSVDGLTLVVLDLSIDKLEEEIRGIERDKREDAAAWNERDEATLRDKQKALADLNTQRQILFSRLITQQGQ